MRLWELLGGIQYHTIPPVTTPAVDSLPLDGFPTKEESDPQLIVPLTPPAS